MPTPISGPISYYKHRYSQAPQESSKELNKKHYKNKKYNMYYWVAPNGEKKYQVNGKMVHSNEFRDILAKEFPEKSNDEIFTYDFRLKVIKDEVSGKLGYYCNGKEITENEYIRLSNQQKTDFLKSMQSVLNDSVDSKEGLSFEYIESVRSVLNSMLNDFEVRNEISFTDCPDNNEFKRSTASLRNEMKRKYRADNLFIKDVKNRKKRKPLDIRGGFPDVSEEGIPF